MVNLDGADQLAAGTARLADGAGTLATGLTEAERDAAKIDRAKARIRAAAVKARDSVTALASGARQVADGNTRLAAAMPALAGGIADAASGARQLHSGARQADTGARQLATGSAQLADGAGQVDDGARNLAGELDKGRDQVPAYTEQERTHLKEVAAAPTTATTDQTPIDTLAVTVVAALALWALARAVATGGPSLATGITQLLVWLAAGALATVVVTDRHRYLSPRQIRHGALLAPA